MSWNASQKRGASKADPKRGHQMNTNCTNCKQPILDGQMTTVTFGGLDEIHLGCEIEAKQQIFAPVATTTELEIEY
jgi:hypothetical protein